MQKIIFIVDDIDANLLSIAAALENDYKVFTMPSAQKMFSFLEKKRPDLILLDIEMPETNGYEAIAILKSRPEWKEIPVIFITGHIDDTVLSRTAELGALEVIQKDDVPLILLTHVREYL
jgi:CheY-like chemotaxis protein